MHHIYLSLQFQWWIPTGKKMSSTYEEENYFCSFVSEGFYNSYFDTLLSRAMYTLLSVVSVSCHKKRKWLQKLQVVSDHWRSKNESFDNRSDDTLATDSQDLDNHSIQLVDI